MKLSAVALIGALFALLAIVQLQYGPEWEANAAVEAAIARGDLKQARELAVTAKHWARIVDARPGRPDANASQPKPAHLMVVRDRARGS
jgi:hypothetical protein